MALLALTPTAILADITMSDTVAAIKMTLMALVLCWIGVIMCRRLSTPETRSFFIGIFVLSFILRIIWSLFLLRVIPLMVHNHQYLSLGMINDDAILFDRLAVLGMKAAQNGLNPFSAYTGGRTGAIAYVFIMTLVYLLVGPELLGVQILNSFFGALVPIFVCLIAQTFVPYAQARLATWLIALYPEQIIYSGSHQKDISIVFGFAVGLWVITRIPTLINRRQRVLAYTLLATMTGFLALNRFYYAVLLGMALALIFVPDLQTLRRTSFAKLMQRAMLLGVLMMMVLVLIAVLVPNGLDLFRSPIVAATGFYRIFTSASDSSGSLYVLFKFPYNIIFFPLPLLGFMLNPFILWPFLAPSEIYWILLPTMIAWYILIPFVVYGFGASNRPGFGRLLFLVVAGAVAILVITGSGLNVAGRSKLPIQPYALIYAVIGFEAFKQNKRLVNWVTGTYAAGLSAVILAYLLFKLPVPMSIMVMALIPNMIIAFIIFVAILYHKRPLDQTPALVPSDDS